MLRHAILSCVCLGFLAFAAKGETHFTAKGLKVVKTWTEHQTDLSLEGAPANAENDPANRIRFGFLENEAAFAKLWKAWRKDAVPPVDFAKQFVLVMTAPANVKVDCRAQLVDGDVRLGVESTEAGVAGMTYVIAVVDRAGVRSVGGKELTRP